MTLQEVLVERLETLRLRHREVEDCWYSCPKSGACCNDYYTADECTCGAGAHNERLDEIIAAVRATQ